MATTRPHLLATAVLALGMLGCLSGCGEAQAAKPTRSASPAPTPSATTTTVPAPAASATPVAATCENLLNSSTLSRFTTGGFTITPTPDFEAKLHREGNYLANFFDAGGVACQVASPNGSSASELYGWAPYVAPNADAVRAALVADSWSVTTSGTTTNYTRADGNDGIMTHCVITVASTMACAIDTGRLTEIRANAPRRTGG